MAKVTQIAVVTPDEKRKAVTIDMLERLLAEAKEGNGFESALFVATYPDSTGVRTSWAGIQSTLDLVGRLEKLKHDLLYEERQREEDVPPPPPPPPPGA